jgi:predicted ArsR family transcriptional regulator
MLLPLLREILHSPVTEIIRHLKQSPGMSVKELCSAMKMSYMGIKQHCMELEKKGCLDTWRRPKPHGRPEKIYRLTPKLDILFPQAGEAMVLELLATAERVFGQAAPEKLLYSLFQAKTERYQARLAQETSMENKVLALARLRTAEGCMSAAEISSDGALRLVDYHCPFAELSKKFPLVNEIECDMIERLLDCTVERRVETYSGLVRVIYRLGKPAAVAAYAKLSEAANPA